jgi:elongation factor Ts
VEYVNAVDIPAEVFEAEKAVEMGREDLATKPEAIRAKIAEGRVKKLVQVSIIGGTLGRGGCTSWWAE